MTIKNITQAISFIEMRVNKIKRILESPNEGRDDETLENLSYHNQHLVVMVAKVQEILLTSNNKL
jgi:hypothetical protein